MAKKKQKLGDKPTHVEKNEEGFNFKIFKVPEGERRAGMWTFTINEEETLFYSSVRAGIEARVSFLLTGQTPADTTTVSLPALQGRAVNTLGPNGEIEREAVPDYKEGKTAEERITRFLNMVRTRKAENEAAAKLYEKKRD